jgi:hypothetical protein
LLEQKKYKIMKTMAFYEKGNRYYAAYLRASVTFFATTSLLLRDSPSKFCLLFHPTYTQALNTSKSNHYINEGTRQM